MKIDFHFLTILDLKNYSFDEKVDPDHVLQTGVELYEKAILRNPYSKNDENIIACVAMTDGIIIGRYMLFRSLLKCGEGTTSVQTGGSFFVSEKYRGIGVGYTLWHHIKHNEIHLGALFSRAGYNIFKETEVMLEIPQYVKYRYHGIKKILDLPIHLRKSILKRRYVVKRHAIVPEWAGAMASSDNHKYMEVHDTAWLQWALDNNATGVESDYQSFYAIYDRNDKPAGFFMTKVRTITKEGDSFVKANLIEWASTDLSRLDEADINILSLDTYPQEVSRFWTISENGKTAKKLKCHSYKRRGWFAMSITKDERFEDIGDVSQWRIRYGCCNTALVE
ncbi:hypothetical protein [Prevotella sp. FD3004]|uniref:hypothetical protein n=1 Tax=Prevotella sp. FD3004 TaxID=1408309 RepID=UPI000ADD9418|nr:hypothetical protein [Prevotella sp. FD3004]